MTENGTLILTIFCIVIIAWWLTTRMSKGSKENHTYISGHKRPFPDAPFTDDMSDREIAEEMLERQRNIHKLAKTRTNWMTFIGILIIIELVIGILVIQKIPFDTL